MFSELVGPIAYADNEDIRKANVEKALTKIIPTFLERLDKFFNKAGGQYFVGGKVTHMLFVKYSQTLFKYKIFNWSQNDTSIVYPCVSVK